MKNLARLSRFTISAALISSYVGMAQAANLPVQAQAQAGTHQGLSDEEAASIYAQVIDEDSLLMKIAAERIGDENILQKLVEKILNEPVEMEMPNGQKESVPRWKKELAKLKIQIPIEIGQSFLNYFRAEVGFEREVQPTNIAGEQLRSDTYKINLGTTKVLKTGAEIRITFSKIFTGPNAKKEALFSKVKWIKEVPRKASEISTKMAVRDTVRIEIQGNLGLVGSFLNKSNKSESFGGIGVEKQGLFLAEFYRKSEKDLITRFMGVVNQGALSGNIGGFKSLFGKLLPGNLGEYLSFGGEASCSTSNLIFKKEPTDTMMVLYRFNMQSQDAVAALDQIFVNIKKLGFIKIFNPIKKDVDLAAELKEKAELAEKYALADQNLPDSEKRVEHEFRGRMTSTFYKCKMGVNFYGALGASDQFGGGLTFVHKYNKQNKSEYYLLENFNSRIKAQAGAGTRETKTTRQLDLLLNSDSNRKIGSLLNMVSHTEFQETQLDRDDMALIRKKFEMGSPVSFHADPKLADVFPEGKQNSATFSIETILGPEALAAMQGQTANFIGVALQKYTENHPERYKMNLPDGYAPGAIQSEGSYIESKGYQIRDFLDSKDTKAQVAAYKQMKKEMFVRQFVLSEFVPSLVPSEGAKDLMGVNLRMSSDETGTKSAPIGNVKVSDVYKAVKFMRRVLEEDRGLKIPLDEIADQDEAKKALATKAEAK